MIRYKYSGANTPEHLRETISISFYTGSCKTLHHSMAALERTFVKFIGECIAWKLDYKNDHGLMKFKNNSQTKRYRGNNSNTNAAFTISVPKTENFCNWRQQ